MRKTDFVRLFCGVMILFLAACSDVEVFTPNVQGEKGDTGLSAYEAWKEQVAAGALTWPKDQVEITDFFKYLKGEDGKDGADGKNGLSAYEQWKNLVDAGNVTDPYDTSKPWPKTKNTQQDFWKYLTGATGETGQTPRIENGTWWIGTENTGIKATGADGKDGADAEPPVVTIGENGNWFVNGTDTGRPSRGEKGDQGDKGDPGQKGENGKDGANGVAPQVTIGENGNWFLDGKDSGKPAVGSDGKSPSVAIGTNGNWYINGKDTGKSAFGRKGDKGDKGDKGPNGANGANGKDGKSAYELWVDEAATGTLDHPHKQGEKWPKEKVGEMDFWEYLTGKTISMIIEIGKYNVMVDYWNTKLKEHVDIKDGSVTYIVYNRDGKVVSSGVKVTGLPGVIDPTKVYTTDRNGKIKVPREQLPDNAPITERQGTSKVIDNGEEFVSARNTLVPNRVNIRLVYGRAYLYSRIARFGPTSNHGELRVEVEVERQIDGKWEAFPSGYSPSSWFLKAGYVKDVTRKVDNVNIDESILLDYYTNRYSSPSLALYTGIRRPIVLTDREKNSTEKNDTILDLKAGEWDGVKRYASLYYGDEGGYGPDYGQKVYLDEKIHVPETNPVPGFVEDKVFIDVKEGVTILWGEFDVTAIPDFYRTFYSSGFSGNASFVKDENTGLWEVPGGRRAASELPGTRIFYLYMQSNIGSTISALNSPTTPIQKGAHFVQAGAYPGNRIGVSMDHQASALSTYIAGQYEYRSRYLYYLQRDASGNYYLEDFNDRSRRIPVQKKPVPAGWRNW